MRLSKLSAAALTLGAGLLTGPPPAGADSNVSSSVASMDAPGVSAESAPPSPSPSGSTTESPTPLALRSNQPSIPLKLSGDSEPATLGWKLALMALVIGGGIYGLRRRSLSRPPNADLVVVRRASVGFRSELLVVNVDGQRLLLGVTPQSIHTLAVLDNADDLGTAASSSPSEPPTYGSRVGAMLDTVAEARPGHSATTATAAPTETEIPGQARGLMSLRRRR
ncbi:MAG: flagellar biosynthetic protein FliO [Polyangiaceae bacterium]